MKTCKKLISGNNVASHKFQPLRHVSQLSFSHLSQTKWKQSITSVDDESSRMILSGFQFIYFTSREEQELYMVVDAGGT